MSRKRQRTTGIAKRAAQTTVSPSEARGNIPVLRSAVHFYLAIEWSSL